MRKVVIDVGEYPKVSVIMPVYNSVKYINEAIDSILNQTFTDFEMILVDDCSDDGTREIIESYKDSRIRIFYNSKNMGVAYTRNRALENARGEYIAILDDDDISLSIRLEMQVKFLDENLEYGVVGGRTQLIDQNGMVINKSNVAYVNPKYIKAIFLFRNVFCNGEVMFRRELAVSNNLRYEENCYGMEDFKFWIKMSKIAKMTNIDELFLKHRVHEKSITSVVAKNLERERQLKFAELQRFSWKESGLQIPTEVAEIIHKYVGEELLKTEITEESVRELYSAMKVFLEKCYGLDNQREIGLFCKSILIQYINKINDFWKEEIL